MSEIAFKSFAIVPAAGRSRRMGAAKLLLPWGECTVMESVLAAWRDSRVQHVIVVVRGDDESLQTVCRKAGVQIVVPATEPPEMKHSILCGLRFVEQNFSPSPHDAWLLAPADMPQLSPAIIDRVLSAHDPAASRILVPTAAGRRAHPVLFPWPLARHVAELGDDQGVNSLRDDHPVRELSIDDPLMLEDLDTPADYNRLAAKVRRSVANRDSITR